MYLGNFHEGLREGQGTVYSAEYEYDGQWKAGKKHGKGKLTEGKS